MDSPFLFPSMQCWRINNPFPFLQANFLETCRNFLRRLKLTTNNLQLRQFVATTPTKLLEHSYLIAPCHKLITNYY